MNTKRRIHDGIAGAVITSGTALGYWVAPVGLLIPEVLALTLLQSGLT